MNRRMLLVLAIVVATIFTGVAPAAADDCTSEIPQNYEEGPGTADPVVIEENGDITIRPGGATYFILSTGGVIVQWVDCID